MFADDTSIFYAKDDINKLNDTVNTEVWQGSVELAFFTIASTCVLKASLESM